MALGPLFVANVKMIARNRQAFFWALIFPLVFVIIFGLFLGHGTPPSDVAVIDNAHDSLSQSLIKQLDQVSSLKVVMRTDEAAARKDVKDGNLDYLLVIPSNFQQAVNSNPPADVTFIYNSGTATSGLVKGVIQQFLDNTNMNLAGAPTRIQLQSQGVYIKQINYFEFLLPGLVCMGIMVYSIIGMASAVSVYREQHVLKRLLATPLRIRTFFVAQILAYLLLALVQTVILIGAGILFFHADVHGNPLSIALIVILGDLVLLTIGFIVGAFSKTVAAASGLGNAVALPMMFFSGVFFSTSSLPGFMSTLVSYLPLTPMVNALRGVTVNAQPLGDFGIQLAVLVGWLIVSSALAIRVFKFS